MSLLVGVPVILPPDPDVVASWNHRPHLIIINGNADAWGRLIVAHDLAFAGFGDNIGVAASWNRIMRFARSRGIDYVALMSQGVQLDGGTARLAELVREHADWRGLLTDFAWRCIVLSVQLWEQLGPFDERFEVGYYEDSDYVRRMFLAGLHSPGNGIPKVTRELLDGVHTEAATLQSGMIDPSWYGENGLRYRDKWNGEPFKETWDRPDDPQSYNATNNWDHYEREK